MEVSAKAWKVFKDIDRMMWKISLIDVDMAVRKHIIPQETQIKIREEMRPSEYGDYLAKQAVDMMAGILELLAVIQKMKNNGTITVKQDEEGGNVGG